MKISGEGIYHLFTVINQEKNTIFVTTQQMQHVIMNLIVLFFLKIRQFHFLDRTPRRHHKSHFPGSRTKQCVTSRFQGVGVTLKRPRAAAIVLNSHCRTVI